MEQSPSVTVEAGKKHYAAEEVISMLEQANAVELCQRMIQNGWDLSGHLGYDGSPLTLAVEENNLSVVKVMLAHGAEPNRPFGFAWKNALWHAARDADPAMIDMLLANGAKIPGSYALHGAAAILAPENVQHLLHLGADPNEVRQDSCWTAEKQAHQRRWNPLLCAVGEVSGMNERLDTSAHVRTVQLLLDAGADPFARDENGNTAIDNARADLRLPNVAALLNAWEEAHAQESK